MLNPVAIVLRGGMFPAMLRQVVTDQVRRMGLLNEFCGTSCFQGAAWMHRNGGAAALDALSEHLGVVPLILACQHCFEVLDALAVRRIGWFQGGAT